MGPFQPWERACLRVLLWGNIASGLVVGSAVLIGIAKVML